MMAWVAVDRLIKMAELGRLDTDLARWKKLRDVIHDEVCRRGFDTDINSFVQYYGGKHLDASILMMPLVGFLPADDVRVIGTVRAIETHLMENGFVGRYTQDPAVDGIPHGEGTFLPCSFWLADNYELQGRHRDAVQIFERLLSIRNDVGLLSEEYDPVARRQLGNFPQAFSHIGLVNTAFNLTQGPSQPNGRASKAGDPLISDAQKP
jgi:GH15 family glucan-1,4-alpha-glucosidase